MNERERLRWILAILQIPAMVVALYGVMVRDIVITALGVLNWAVYLTIAVKYLELSAGVSKNERVTG